MVFNLFHLLMLLMKQEPVIVTLVVRSVFRNFPVFEVTEIDLEFIPTPIENYTMDACVRFMDNKGEKHIIAIEAKYTDMLGVNVHSLCKEQKQIFVDTGLFSADFEELLMGGKVNLSDLQKSFTYIAVQYGRRSEELVFSGSFAKGSSVNRRWNQLGYRVP